MERAAERRATPGVGKTSTVSTKPERSARPLSGSVAPRRCSRLAAGEASGGRVGPRSPIPDVRVSPNLPLSSARHPPSLLCSRADRRRRDAVAELAPHRRARPARSHPAAAIGRWPRALSPRRGGQTVGPRTGRGTERRERSCGPSRKTLSFGEREGPDAKRREGERFRCSPIISLKISSLRGFGQGFA